MPAQPSGTGAGAPKIAVRGVSKAFVPARKGPARVALSQVSLDIAADSFVALLGPSGCGKTTLLRLINGLIQPDTGDVLIDGTSPHPGPQVGFVFQSFRLIPWRTVRANAAFALEAAGVGRPECRERADRYLKMVGLAQFADSYPHELSGGMKQRLALARALATEPDILLMDEPFASIDALAREVMQTELMRLWARRRGVIVFVTHSIDEAILLADRVVLMSARPGRVVGEFEIDLPRPRWEYDVHSHPRFVALRAALWARIRTMIAADPASDLAGLRQSSSDAGDAL
jgi:NitT/TauT family transport system ATP-binding protein